MSNRWLRFGIALLALGAAAAAGYRIYDQEQRLAHDVATTRAADLAAETALTTVSELKAALHAYLADGQGSAFWTARSAMLIDRLRASVLELDNAPAAAADIDLTETLDLTDRLAASEARAKEHVRLGQRLLAGEVIFTEARDLLDTIRLQVAGARTSLRESADAAHAEIRQEHAALALGAGGILAFATLLLVIPGRAAAAGTLPAESVAKGEPPVAEDSTARVVSRTPLSAAQTAPAAETPPPARQPKPVAPPAAPAVPGLLREAASVCTDLGRVSQSIEISVLLERAARVLDATGVIVWMASPETAELYPAASAGYNERLLARIGSIPRDSNNLTASALRDAASKTSSRGGQSAAALAVPLMTPLGPVGVLSAEIREPSEVDETRLALAIIFAAQLATILGSMATPAATGEPEPAKETAPPAATAQA